MDIGMDSEDSSATEPSPAGAQKLGPRKLAAGVQADDGTAGALNRGRACSTGGGLSVRGLHGDVVVLFFRSGERLRLTESGATQLLERRSTCDAPVVILRTSAADVATKTTGGGTTDGSGSAEINDGGTQEAKRVGTGPVELPWWKDCVLGMLDSDGLDIGT
jgi:hypothetical protein